jgi:GT2 family glycosyltransferase
MKVIATIIWLNYNSMRFISIAKKSLRSIYRSNIPLELIVVDNASTDGSFEEITRYLDKLKERDFNIKIIRLNKNLGFTGGNNIGYLKSDPKTKYIIFINNDLVLYEDSLEHITHYLDLHKDVGIAQGVIYDISGRNIDNAGFICTETLLNIPIKTLINEPTYITYASGAYMVVRRELISKLGVPFDWDGFMYYDDMPLGFKTWSAGFKIISLPIEAGKHLGGASGGLVSEKTLYYMYRGWGIIIEVSNTRFKKLLKKIFVKNIPIVSGIKNPRLIKVATKGFIEGLRLGRMKRELGYSLDIYSAPLITKYNLSSLFLPNRLMHYLISLRY